MLRGDKVGLRARAESDVPILHAELYEDVAVTMRLASHPWRPIPLGAGSPYAVPTVDDLDRDSLIRFSVVELASGELAGSAVLWGLDRHLRSAHLGMALRPTYRGRGLAGDILRTLCYYGFAVRGLHRLQVDTLADNEAMLRVALAGGFVREATARRAAWVGGQFLDEVVLGQLAAEWTGSKSGSEWTGSKSESGSEWTGSKGEAA